VVTESLLNFTLSDPDDTMPDDTMADDSMPVLMIVSLALFT
jgi:hypothetical protein